jgi:Ca-activated chloride channel family protein
LQNSPYEVSALLIGTEAGAPIALSDGQLLKDYTGNIVVPSINANYIEQAMYGTSGVYKLFADDNSDIDAIKRKIDFEQQQQSKAMENSTGDTLRDMGPYIILILLPIAAYSFRKGVLSVAILGVLLMGIGANSSTAYAQLTPEDNMPGSPSQVNAGKSPTQIPDVSLANPNVQPETLIDKVFKNTDQRGKIAFDNQDYNKAEALFENDEWRAANAYKKGDYEQAAALYTELVNNKQGNLTNNLYNQGNALAKQGKLEDAIKAYEKALENNPEYKHAIANKKLVEDLLNQQQQKDREDQKQQDSDESQDGESQDGESQDGESQDGESQDGESQDGESQDGESQDGESQDGESQDGESQDGESQDGESQDGESQDGESQDGESQDGDSQSGDEQNSEKQNDEALKQGAQEQKNDEDQAQENTAEQNESAQAQQSKEEDAANEQAQQAAISNQVNMDDLTPEQKEELQRMQMILNKIPDDPAYLLKRKMQLEAYKRKNNPPSEQENW